MIRASHLAAIAERPQVVKKQEVEPAKPTNLIICANCKLEKKKRSFDLCAACYDYQHTHKKNRPMHLVRLELEKQERSKWCHNCGSPNIRACFLCMPCYNYKNRTGKHRPKWLRDDEFCCTVCGIPKRLTPLDADGATTFRKGKCRACASYQRYHGKPRPPELWGNGKYGWCDCGYPAEHQIDKINMCNRCVKEYR